MEKEIIHITQSIYPDTKICASSVPMGFRIGHITIFAEENPAGIEKLQEIQRTIEQVICRFQNCESDLEAHRRQA